MTPAQKTGPAKSGRAFTLIELLVVIAIIGSLVALLMPTIAAMQQKADSLKCISNLKQIGVSAILYATDHNSRTPVIEPFPDNPVYQSSDGAQSLLQAFGSYGVNSAVLQCPADLKGANYFKKEGSSYQWSVIANGQNVQSPKFPFLIGQNINMTMSKLFMAFDYTAVHNGGSNVLFGDGHVAVGN